MLVDLLSLEFLKIVKKANTSLLYLKEIYNMIK